MSERTFTFTESELRRLLGEAFDLFFEFRDDYEYTEESAEVAAIDELMEGLTFGMDALREWNEGVKRLVDAEKGAEVNG